MCFSPNASFLTSAFLIIVGTLAIKKIRTKKQLPLSLIPYFFAIQQATEGFLWLTLQGTINISVFALSYIYLFFALLFWPIWLPFSILCLEPEKIRKTLISITLLIGVLVSAYLGYLMITGGVNAEIISKHIFYDFKSRTYNYDIAFYLIATVLPFFISSIKILWFFGSLLLISLIISFIFYFKFFLSVWCFVSAILSLFVYYVIKKQ